MADWLPSSTTVASRLSDRWLLLRNRLLQNRRFQRWAASFPFTRPITRRRTRALFDIAGGFVYSQVLFACTQLELFDKLAGQPRDLDDLRRETGLESEALQRLLLAAESLGLLQRCRDGRWTLGPHGAAILGNPGIASMVRHHALLYADLADPIALLRDRSRSMLSQYWPYAASDVPDGLTQDAVKDYSDLMAQSQGFVADDVLDAFPMRGPLSLLDLGGGAGVFAAHAANRWPELTVTLFDLPAVAAIASERIHAAGLDERVAVLGGDLFADELPSEFDVVSLVRVIHDHDDAEALAILQAAERVLRPGGRLLIAEPMAGTRGAEPMGDAYFGFYLWAMGSGRGRRFSELQQIVQRAGFESVREVRAARPLLVRILVATKH